VSRRVLSPLESIERDAIVQSLLDHGGNKIRAARALGMSRATIYRRIHEYGIVTQLSPRALLPREPKGAPLPAECGGREGGKRKRSAATDRRGSRQGLRAPGGEGESTVTR
jgi:hypothetical protein